MRSEEYNQAFSIIAPYYDQLMSFINYPSWISYIKTILALNNTNEKTILDLACGTGTCLELWLQNGYKVIGLDNSLPMLEVCRKRLTQHDTYFFLINGDMRNLPLTKRIPIITCLYDSLNYFLSETDLLYCFEKIYDTLSDNGIFIFDMNTIHALRDEWGNQTFHRKDENIYSVWINTFDPLNNISSLRLTLDIHTDGKQISLKELHQERAYPLSTINNLLTQVGFKPLLYRHMTFNPAQESDLRIMGVARR